MFQRNLAAKRQTIAHLHDAPTIRFAQSARRCILAGWACGSRPVPAPDCQDRYPSPILRPGPLRVGPSFSGAVNGNDGRSVAGFARKSQNSFDPCAPRGDMGPPTTNNERGSLPCLNPCSHWPQSACWPPAMVRSIPTAPLWAPLPVWPSVPPPITIWRKARLPGASAVRLPPIRACAADRLIPGPGAGFTAIGATAPVAVCVWGLRVTRRGGRCFKRY